MCVFQKFFRSPNSQLPALTTISQLQSGAARASEKRENLAWETGPPVSRVSDSDGTDGRTAGECLDAFSLTDRQGFPRRSWVETTERTPPL